MIDNYKMYNNMLEITIDDKSNTNDYDVSYI